MAASTRLRLAASSAASASAFSCLRSTARSCRLSMSAKHLVWGLKLGEFLRSRGDFVGMSFDVGFVLGQGTVRVKLAARRYDALRPLLQRERKCFAQPVGARPVEPCSWTSTSPLAQRVGHWEGRRGLGTAVASSGRTKRRRCTRIAVKKAQELAQTALHELINISKISKIHCGSGGGGGIRTLDGLLAHTPLAGERLQPLGHSSA